MKNLLRKVLRERTTIGAVVTAVAVELQADLDNPDFHWRDLIIVLIGIGLRTFTKPANE